MPVYISASASRQYGKPTHGWDGIEFERLWSEALRRENVTGMIAETNEQEGDENGVGT